MNVKTSNERLLKLAAFLDTVPRKRFDYGSFVGDEWGGAQDLSCGTTACALGWAATMPEFRRLGLRLIKVFGEGEVIIPREGIAESFEAGMHIFGLEEEESNFLFAPSQRLEGFGISPTERATAQTVAKHIRRFVEKRVARV